MSNETLNTTEVKYCNRCNTEKPLNEFYIVHRDNIAQVVPYCKSCCGEIQREWIKKDTSRYTTEARKNANKKYQSSSQKYKEGNRERQRRFREKQKEINKSNFVSLIDCRSLVFEFEENINVHSEDFKIAVVFLYGTLNGIHEPQQLSKATKFSAGWIFGLCNNLEKNGIWKNGCSYLESLFVDETAEPLSWIVEFWLCIGAASGQFVRASSDEGWLMTK